MAFFFVHSLHITHISSKLTLNWMVLLTSKTVAMGSWIKRPKRIALKPPYRAKVSVRCGVSKMGIIGSFLFKKRRWLRVTVNFKHYVTCSTMFCGYSFRLWGSTWQKYFFNKMEPQPAWHGLRLWQSFEEHFLNTWVHVLTISTGLIACQICGFVTSSY